MSEDLLVFGTGVNHRSFLKTATASVALAAHRGRCALSGTRPGAASREHIFEPLRLKDTGFSVPASKMDRLPNAYWTDYQTGALGLFNDARDSPWSRPTAFAGNTRSAFGACPEAEG